MKTFAVVNSTDGGLVTNVIVGGDLEGVMSVVGDCVEITEETGPAGINWTWDPQAGKFIQPTT